MTDKELRLAYEGESEFRSLVQWALGRKKNAWVTSLDVFERELGLSRARSVKLAERLELLGCGKYVKGRRSWKSRVEWSQGLWGVVDTMTEPTSRE